MTGTQRKHINCSNALMFARGFSLVEMMIAMTISLVIILTVTQIFVSSRATYSYTEGLSRVQEGGRFAIDFLAQDIRMAGYSGCARRLNSANVSNVVKDIKKAVDYDIAGMEVYRYTGTGGTGLGDWTPALPNIANAGIDEGYFSAGEVEPFTDVFVSKYGVSVDATITAPADKTANLKVLSTPETDNAFTQNDVLMVTDCNNADIFSISNTVNTSGDELTFTHGNGTNTSNRLANNYDSRAEILRWESRVYYIGRPDLDGDGNPDANANPTLMRKALVKGSLISQPLVEGVERMQIMLGMDTDTIPEKFRDSTANQYVHPDYV
ncbi:MAG: PilW family protein, partial [Proteobacteria bacterium]|nr:PilW family protein [Pseudomonadota bacterium]